MISKNFRELKLKANVLKKIGILLLFNLLLVQLCLVSAVQATVPDADELDWVCREAATQLVAGSGERRLDNVAVYFFRPRGYSQKRMDDRAQKEARIVAQAMEDVLTNRSEFKILNRNSDVWAAVLLEEDNRGTLNSRDILDVGTGFGADWIVTGEYWFGSNNCFNLRTRLFNGKTGETLASALVESPFVSSRHRVQPLVIGLVVFLLLVAGGSALYLISRNRKIRRYEQVDVDHENNTQQTQSSILSKKFNPGSHQINLKVHPKELLMAKSVNPKHFQIDPVNCNYTKPRTWGVFTISDKSATGKKYRFGNYPVRQKELEKEFGLVEFIALFEKRDDAEALINLLENE